MHTTTASGFLKCDRKKKLDLFSLGPSSSNWSGLNDCSIAIPWPSNVTYVLHIRFLPLFMYDRILTFSGVPKLKRSELEAACEDFSNVIGTSPIGTLYKGTLSSGVEIAVAFVPVTSSRNWSKTLEAQFRSKVHQLL